MTLDLSGLKRTLPKWGTELDSVWPIVALTLYSRRDVAELGAGAADCLGRYLEVIPDSALRSGLIGEAIRPLTPQRVKRDLK